MPPTNGDLISLVLNDGAFGSPPFFFFDAAQGGSFTGLGSLSSQQFTGITSPSGYLQDGGNGPYVYFDDQLADSCIIANYAPYQTIEPANPSIWCFLQPSNTSLINNSFNPATNGNTQVIFTKTDTPGGAGFAILCTTDSTGQPTFSIKTVGHGVVSLTGPQMSWNFGPPSGGSGGNWQMISMSFDSATGNFSIFYNGLLVAQTILGADTIDYTGDGDWILGDNPNLGGGPHTCPTVMARFNVSSTPLNQAGFLAIYEEFFNWSPGYNGGATVTLDHAEVGRLDFNDPVALYSGNDIFMDAVQPFDPFGFPFTGFFGQNHGLTRTGCGADGVDQTATRYTLWTNQTFGPTIPNIECNPVSYTWYGWVKIHASVGGGTPGTIILFESQNEPRPFELSVLAGGGTTPSAIFHTSMGVSKQLNFPALTVGVCTQLAVTWDGQTGTFRIYANGAQVGQILTPGDPWIGWGSQFSLNGGATAGVTALYVGGLPSTNDTFPGEIEKFHQWRRALSATEILILYNADLVTRPTAIATLPGGTFNPTNIIQLNSLAFCQTACAPIVSYQWTQPAGPAGTFLPSSTDPNPTFTMPSTAAPVLISFNLVVTDSNGRQSLPVELCSVDSPLSFPPAGVPVAGNFVPTLGTPILPTTPISFTVTDSAEALRQILVVATFSSLNIKEVIHDGISFGPLYQNPLNNTRTSYAPNGYQYNILRDGGWPASPVISVYAVDTSGGSD